MTNYSREFKEDAVANVQNHPDKSVTQCAKDLGVNPNTLHGWLNRVKRAVSSIVDRAIMLRTKLRESLA